MNCFHVYLLIRFWKTFFFQAWNHTCFSYSFRWSFKCFIWFFKFSFVWWVSIIVVPYVSRYLISGRLMFSLFCPEDLSYDLWLHGSVSLHYETSFFPLNTFFVTLVSSLSHDSVFWNYVQNSFPFVHSVSFSSNPHLQILLLVFFITHL